MTLRESVREEILSSALRGLLEVCEKYAPVEPGPGHMRYLPGNGGGGHSIERELRIARESLTEPVPASTQPTSTPPVEDGDWPGEIWRVQVEGMVVPDAFHVKSEVAARGWEDTGAQVRRYVPAPAPPQDASEGKG
jgi:hypothetical protein